MIHEMERAEEGFARHDAITADCLPGHHQWTRTRRGGVCDCCHEELDEEEL